MQNDNGANEGRTLATNRAMEILVALVLLGGCAVVIYDSMRIGFGWREGEGPAPGYFPFWVAVILALSSFANLWGAVRGRGAGEIFVTLRPFGRVLAVLVPSVFYVALIGGISIGPVAIPALGMYVASAIFICAFMLVIGRENPVNAIGVALFIPAILFFMFEKWFLVPLPKGPLEVWLGY